MTHFEIMYVNDKIVVPANPGQPSKPTASEVTKDSVKFSFGLQFMGTGVVKQFVVNITKAGSSGTKQIIPANDRMISSSNMTVTVGGLEADSTYSFQVAAVNDVGMGPFSEMSNEITTGEGHLYAITSCTETLWLL